MPTPYFKKLIMASKKHKDIVQTKNPRSGKYIKIDRDNGRIISTKKSYGPYKNIPVVKKRRNA